MTLSEFKAWFEGYTEGLEAAPTKAQFDRIKEKVKEIDGAPITQTVFLTHYWRPYPIYNQPPYYWSGGQQIAGVGAQMTGAMQAQNVIDGSLMQNDAVNQFDSQQAMYALGKAEAMN